MFYTYVTFTNTCIIACERHQAGAPPRSATEFEPSA